MTVLGLCGGSGSGKGTACSYFAELGIKIIDTDAIYHELTSKDSPCLREISSTFGDGVVVDGTLNRKRLAAIVFSDSEMLLKLNSITHTHILNEVRRRISEAESAGYSGVIVDAPVLFESGFDKECDLTMCIIADDEIRLQRIMERDGISRENAARRLSSQKSNVWLLSNCDRHILNNTTREELRLSVIAEAKKIFDIKF